ncbi:myb-interacting protein 120 [Haematobia irritans]|uniref:myb-interacting protein 120 n=1 Tax=Haematobia irritans TaxID=7368 RepID=UPI003F5063F6
MDISSNMDSLDDTSSLPELSFDDFLDSSPLKKNGNSIEDDDSLECDNDSQDFEDDTLNTPGPKKTRIVTKNLNSGIATSKSTTLSVRSNPIKTTFVKNNTSTTTTTGSTHTSAPVLLNTKNILPKMSTHVTNTSIKITPKTVVTTAPSSSAGSNISMSGKTAVRTSSGQVIYIQKNAGTLSSTSSANPIKTSGNVAIIKQSQQQYQMGNPNTSGTVTMNTNTNAATTSKPVTIKVVRSSDGSFVPLKSSTSAGANIKNTTLTLSPNTMGGKKIITTTGGQVVIKSANTSSSVVSSPNVTGLKTVLKPTTSVTSSGDIAAKPNTPKSIVVQSSSGKQILVANSNFVKLSPQTQIPASASEPVVSTSTGNSASTGKIQAIQLPNKPGVQYVRVVTTSSSKTIGQVLKSVTVSSAAATSMTSSTKTTMVTSVASSSATPSTLASSTAPVKILNNLPQKFTVVQKGGGTKVVLTQKKDGNGLEYSPVASKVQKTMVTMPILKTIKDETGKVQPHTLVKTPHSSTTTLVPSSIASGQNLVRKHKISEINTELKRMTSATDNDDGGPPDIKKAMSNNRLVVISSSGPTILNSGVQHQQGRVKMIVTNTSSSGVTMVQGTKTIVTPSTSSAYTSASNSNSIASGNKLYTILKPSGQQNPGKYYSVLKASTGATTAASQATFVTSSSTPTQSTASSSSSNGGSQKPLLNKQSLIQQQQKIFHLKQLQKPKPLQTATSIVVKSSSSTFYQVKIKEEPVEHLDISSEKQTASSSSALQSLGAAELQDDPNKIDLVAGVRRKHCNCSKSQCLKLYCDCFANGEFCQDCTCKDCFNNLENEDERQRAIRSCLERNPSAFKPKITSSSDQGDMRLHNKGCNCKRSGCLKNYCECYEAKIPCSSNCKCVGCRNVEDRPDLDMDPVDSKLMATIANASASGSQKRSYDKRDSIGNAVIKSEKLTKDSIKQEYGDMDVDNNDMTGLEKPQCNFITPEVVDATIQCMITQADECQKNGLSNLEMEKMVMEELGRCLVEIIDFSIRNADNSYTQD